jgi:hypothetical protein
MLLTIPRPALAATLAIVSAAGLLSCGAKSPARTYLIPSRPALDAGFPPPPPGERTQGVEHVLALFSQLRAAGPLQHFGFQLTEAEINEYLAYSLKTKPRPGIRRAMVKLLPDNRVDALVTIDLGALQLPWLLPQALRPLLSGERPVRVDAGFQVDRAANLTFTLRDVRAFDGTPIPGSVMGPVLQLIGLKQPEYFDTSRPVPLPFGLRRVWTQQGILAGEK